METDAKAPSVRDDKAVERHASSGSLPDLHPFLLPQMLQSRVRSASQHNIGCCREAVLDPETKSPRPLDVIINVSCEVPVTMTAKPGEG
jgi:hypothetical protein